MSHSRSGPAGVIIVRDCVDAGDLEAAWRIRALAFGESPTPQDGWTAGGWRGWVAELDGRVCGFARAWPYRQFFGGRAVPMAGLASVAVDPYARGRGVASAMLDALLPALREAGQPVSALYPSVFELYQARGWETVGVYEWVEVPLPVLRSVPPQAGEVALRPAVAEDLPALHDCYLRFAASVDGMLDRRGPPFEPWRLLELDVVTVAGDRPAAGRAAGGVPRGYVAAARAAPGLVVYDLVAHDTDALRALVRSLASWAGKLPSVRLRLLEPRAQLPAALGTELSSEQWMLRVVDLPAAVAARGWPRAAQLRPGLAVDIDVVDRHAPWHAGPHRLVVSPGGGVLVERGGTGAVWITARGLAAWYAGSASSAGLRRAGLLDGDPATAAALDALTAGTGPPRLGNAF